MLKKLQFWLTALVLMCSASAYADVVEFSNYNFEDGDAIDNGVTTYYKDMSDNGTTYFGLQEVTSWTASMTGDSEEYDESMDAMSGAVFEYGSTSTWLGSNTYFPPTTDPDGDSDGQCLGIVAVWGATAYYISEEVTLAPGNYRISIPVYNGAGTASITNCTKVTLSDGTTYSASSTTYTVGSWTTEKFYVSVSDTVIATVTLGYTSLGSGSGSNPHLFYDGVYIEPFDLVIVSPAENDEDSPYTLLSGDEEEQYFVVDGEYSGIIFTANIDGVEYNDDSDEPWFTLYKDADTSWKGYSDDANSTKNADEFYCEYTSKYPDETGWYTAVFPEGVLRSSDESSFVSNAASFRFYFKEATSYEVDITLDYATPAEGDTVTQLEGIYLSATLADTLWNIEAIIDSVAEQILVTDEDGNPYDIEGVTIGKTDITQVAIYFEEAITDEGIYTFTIPEGLLADSTYYYGNGGHISAAGEFTYVVAAADIDWTSDPADGDTLTSLSSIKIYADGGETAISAGYYNPVLYKDGEVYENISGANYTGGWSTNDDWTETTYYLSVALSDEITAEGTYTLVFGDSTIQVGEDDDDVYYLKDTLSFSWYVDGSAAPAYNVTCDPEDGSTVDSIYTFSITFNDYTTAAFSTTSAAYVYTDSACTTTYKTSYEDDSGNTLYRSYYTSTVVNDGNTITMTLNYAVTEDGTYYIQLPAKRLTLDGTTLTSSDDPLIISYTVKAPQYTVVPANGSEVTQIDTIALTFPNYAKISYRSGSVYIYKDGSYAGYGGSSSRYSVSGNTIKIWFNNSPFTDLAEYTVKIPSGYVYFYDNEDDAIDYDQYLEDAIELTYTVVEATEEEEETTTIEEGDYYFKVSGEYQYLSRGGNWGTEAVIGEYGIGVSVVSNGNGTYAFRDRDVYLASGNTRGYLTGPTSVYADGNGGDGSWTLSENEDGTYYIINSNGNYVTFDEASGTASLGNTYSYLYFSETSDEASAYAFELLTEEEYAADLAARLDEYAAAVATAAGIEVETLEDFETAVAEYDTEDYSDYIANADYTSSDGWTLEQINPATYSGTFDTTNGAFEIYGAAGNLYQTISGLDEGLYKVEVNALQRQFPASYYTSYETLADVDDDLSYLYATTATSEYQTQVATWTSYESYSDVNTISTFVEAAENYGNTLYVYVSEGEDLTIGITQPDNSYYGSWTIATGWTLTLLAEEEEEEDDDTSWYTADPEDGSTVDSLSVITVTFTNASSVVSSSAVYVFTDSTLTTNALRTTGYTNYGTPSCSDSVMTITLLENITDEGTYYFQIRASKTTIDGSAMEEDIILTYTVAASEEEEEDTLDVPTYDDITIDPASGSTLTSITSFSVTYEAATSVNYSSWPYIYSDSACTTTVTYCKPSVSGNTVTFTANTEVTEDGTYYIVVKDKATLDGSSTYGQDITIIYVVDSSYTGGTDDGDDDDDDDDDDEETTTTVTITPVTLVEGGEYETLEAESTIAFTIEPASSVGYAFYKLGTTEDGGDIKSRSTLTYNEETGYWEAEIVYDVKLDEEGIYVTVYAYASESDFNYSKDYLAYISYKIVGTAEKSVLSDVTLESISPTPTYEDESGDEVKGYLSSSEDQTITLVFSDKVSIDSSTSFVNYGQGVTYDFSSITASTDSTTWYLVVSTTTMSYFTDGGMNITVVATDSEGNRVYSETYSESEDADYTYMNLLYYFSESTGLTNYTVSPADGETVDSLSTIVITYGDESVSIVPTWTAQITITDSTGTTTKVSLSEDYVSYDGNVITVDVSYLGLEDGTYTITIPEGFFCIEDDADSKNAEITITITVSSSEEEETTSLDGDYYFKVSGEYQYLTRAGNWGTELTLGSVGTLFTINDNGDGTFYLTTTDAVAAGASGIYVTGPTSAYVDASSGAATWSLEDAGDDTYYIVNSNGNYLTGTYYEDTDLGYAYYYIGEASSDAPAFELLSKAEYLESLSARLDDQAATAAEAAGLSATTVEELETAVANYYTYDQDVDYDDFSAIYTNGATGIYVDAAISDPTIEVFNGCGGAELTLDSLTAGLYKVTLNAMSRAFLITSYYTTDDDGNTVATDLADVSSDEAFIYANDAIDQTAFYSDYEGYLDINSISDFTTAAEDGAYEKVLYVYVADGEDLTIGFQAPYRTNYEASWTITANWTVTLLSEEEITDDTETAISSINAESTFEPTAIYSVSGQLVRTQATSFEGLNKGIYIVNGQKVLVK